MGCPGRAVGRNLPHLRPERTYRLSPAARGENRPVPMIVCATASQKQRFSSGNMQCTASTRGCPGIRVPENDPEKPPDCAVGVPARAVGGLLEHVFRMEFPDTLSTKQWHTLFRRDC